MEKRARMGKRQALAAANLMEKIQRPIHRSALDRLSAFAAEAGIFDHTEEHDDWSSYEERCRIEREQDPVVVQHKIAPKDALKEEQERKITERAKITTRIDPNYLLREAQKADKEKANDPTSVDWRDPHDEGRTKLHKLVFDQNLREIRHHVEALHANPGIRDNNGHSPLQLAINEGYLEIASYLKAAFRQHLETARTCTLQSA